MNKELGEKVRAWISIISMSIIVLIVILSLIKSLLGYNKDISIAMIGFAGSIVGGVVGGLLTLYGVKMTIKNQYEKEYRDTLPQKLMCLEDLLFFVKQQQNLMERALKRDHDIKDVYQRLSFTLEGLQKDGLLMRSSEVNLETYRIVREFHDFIKNFLSPIGGNAATSESEIRSSYKKCVGNLEIQYSLIIKKLNEGAE